jgi:hypothetical protein
MKTLKDVKTYSHGIDEDEFIYLKDLKKFGYDILDDTIAFKNHMNRSMLEDAERDNAIIDAEINLIKKIFDI